MSKDKKDSIFSWRLNEEDLKNQIENYHNLGIFKSYKTIPIIVILFFIFSAILAIKLGLGLTLSQALPALILYCLLLIFIYKGHRWSFILLMIIFTAEIIYKEIEGFEMFGKIRISPIFWWFFIMPFLYKALRVENARKKIKKEIKITEIATPINKSSIFCQSCGKKNINEANYCKKCGNKIIK